MHISPTTWYYVCASTTHHQHSPLWNSEGHTEVWCEGTPVRLPPHQWRRDWRTQAGSLRPRWNAPARGTRANRTCHTYTQPNPTTKSGSTCPQSPSTATGDTAADTQLTHSRHTRTAACGLTCECRRTCCPRPPHPLLRRGKSLRRTERVRVDSSIMREWQVTQLSRRQSDGGYHNITPTRELGARACAQHTASATPSALRATFWGALSGMLTAVVARNTQH